MRVEVHAFGLEVYHLLLINRVLQTTQDSYTEEDLLDQTVVILITIHK